MLRILRYSPNATTNTVLSEQSQEINASQSGTVWFTDFSVPDAPRDSLRYDKGRMSQTADTFELLRAKREEIQRIASKHGARNIRVFGSVARGDARPDSDVDFLIDAEAVTSSWFPAGLVQDLESLLGRRVEVVTERGLNHLIRDEVLREAVPV
jgi:predicted nucleotidyltransferase